MAFAPTSTRPDIAARSPWRPSSAGLKDGPPARHRSPGPGGSMWSARSHATSPARCPTRRARSAARRPVTPPAHSAHLYRRGARGPARGRGAPAAARHIAARHLQDVLRPRRRDRAAPVRSAALRCADVDLMGGVLTVRQTKFAKSRLVPLHPTAASELTRYDELRRRHVPVAADAPFFVSAKGVALASRTVHSVFAGLRAQLGSVFEARTRRADPRPSGTPSSVAGSPSGRRTGPTSTMPCSRCPPMSATPR